MQIINRKITKTMHSNEKQKSKKGGEILIIIKKNTFKKKRKQNKDFKQLSHKIKMIKTIIFLCDASFHVDLL